MLNGDCKTYVLHTQQYFIGKIIYILCYAIYNMFVKLQYNIAYVCRGKYIAYTFFLCRKTRNTFNFTRITSGTIIMNTIVVITLLV